MIFTHINSNNSKPGQIRLFHYTTFSRLLKILTDESISPANLHVAPPERPVVWFSRRLDWEPTATPALITNGQHQSLTFADLTQIDTPSRIEVNQHAAPLDWRSWRKTSGVTSRTVKGLEKSALRLNASVADWRMSFEPVTVEKWLDIELFIGGQWRGMDDPIVKSRVLVNTDPS